MPRGTAPILWLVLAAGLLVAGCESNPDVTPSPLPPGYRPVPAGRTPSDASAASAGQELDEKLAVVAGEVITRRRLVREMKGRAPGQDEAAFERRIHEALKQRAQLLLFVKEAQRAGLFISEQRLDEAVKRRLEEAVKEASENVGEPVTIDEYLAEQNLTRPEYRERVKEAAYFEAYLQRLLVGVGGPTRPMVDLKVAPHEVRSIYWAHPGALDDKPGVRFALFQIPVKRYLEGDASFTDAEAAAGRDAEALATGFRRGETPQRLAEAHRLETGSWNASPAGKFAEQSENVVRGISPEIDAWVFDAARRPLDAAILPSADGPIVMGILELRPGRKVTYEEAYQKIEEKVLLARRARAVQTRLIEILATRNEVEPPELADELLADARLGLQELDRDPILAAARFR